MFYEKIIFVQSFDSYWNVLTVKTLNHFKKTKTQF